MPTISIEDFLDSMYRRSHSTNTRETYSHALTRFDIFANKSHRKSMITVVDLILSGRLDAYSVLDNFVKYLDKTCEPSSIMIYLAAVKRFMRFSGVKIYRLGEWLNSGYFPDYIKDKVLPRDLRGFTSRKMMER